MYPTHLIVPEYETNTGYRQCLRQIFQMNKVLNFMDLKYEQLYSKEEKHAIKRQGFYREKTNVFCYYILKSILFYNLSDFLLFCKENNRNYVYFSKTEKNLIHFSNLIKNYCIRNLHSSRTQGNNTTIDGRRGSRTKPLVRTYFSIRIADLLTFCF